MKFFIETLGCKVNAYESAAIASLLEERGHTPTDKKEEADVLVLNSCAVTAEGERKSHQRARQLRRSSPEATLVVLGCASQKDGESFLKAGADLVYGTHPKFSFVPLLTGKRPEVAKSFVEIPRKTRWDYEEGGKALYEERARAFLKIEDGCDSFCAYCLIPYLRGPVRSRAPEAVYQEALTLSNMGYHEIVLTGIHLGKYGVEGVNLSRLCAHLLHILPSDVRIRLGSLESSEVDGELLSLLKDSQGRLCPHFHLPLQSGCQKTLSKMGRPYDTSDYLRTVGAIRQAYPGVAIAADFICGFPGETEEDFQESLAFVEKAHIDFLHAFPYSSRPGTRGALYPQVAPSIKKERTKEAIALGKKLQGEYEASLLGLEDEIVVEEVLEDGYVRGKSGRYIDCTIYAPKAQRKGLVKGVYGQSLQIS